jgi:hypothetical protein
MGRVDRVGQTSSSVLFFMIDTQECLSYYNNDSSQILRTTNRFR